MAECDDEFLKARQAFREASEATNIVSMRRLADIGLLYLDRADALSVIMEVDQCSSAPNRRA